MLLRLKDKNKVSKIFNSIYNFDIWYWWTITKND